MVDWGAVGMDISLWGKYSFVLGGHHNGYGYLIILECRNSDTAFPRGSGVIHNNIKAVFIVDGMQLCKLFSIGKCFIFKEDFIFRVCEKNVSSS